MNKLNLLKIFSRILNLYKSLLLFRNRIVKLAVDRHYEKMIESFNMTYIAAPSKNRINKAYVIPKDYTKLYNTMKKY